MSDYPVQTMWNWENEEYEVLLYLNGSAHCLAETNDKAKADSIVSAVRLTLEYALPAWRQETLDGFKKLLDSNPNL